MDQQSQRSSQKLDVSDESSSVSNPNAVNPFLDLEFHLGVFTSLRRHSDCHHSSPLRECLREIPRAFQTGEQGRLRAGT